MFRRIRPLDNAQIGVVVGAVLAGAIGLLGAGPVGMLAWLTLIAPACGALVGAAGIRLWPFGLAVPGAWFFFLIWADLAAERDLPTPIWGGCVIGGLFAAGLAAGHLCPDHAKPDHANFHHPIPGRPWALAGLLLLVTLAAGSLCAQAGLGRRSWAADHPGLARALVEVSPLVIATESCGLDWTHVQPQMYALSGVEWFQRRPYRGPLAGSTLLLVGCALAFVASRRRSPS